MRIGLCQSLRRGWWSKPIGEARMASPCSGRRHESSIARGGGPRCHARRCGNDRKRRDFKGARPARSWSGSRTTRRTVGRRRLPRQQELQGASIPTSMSTSSTRRGATHLQKFDAGARGRRRARRDRVGQHGDDEVHGCGRLQDADAVGVPQQQDLAPGPEGLVPVQRQALRRPVLRRRACRHLPQGPVQRGRHQVDAEEPRAVHRGREEADEEVRQGQRLLGRLLPGQVLVRRDVLRLRLRRADRGPQGRQVEGNAQLPAGARGARIR